MKSHLRKTILALAAALLAIAGSAQAADVTIGYQLVYGPWKAKMNELRAKDIGDKSIEFVKFTSGTEVINAMASGSIALSLNSSSPTAAGYSRGVSTFRSSTSSTTSTTPKRWSWTNRSPYLRTSRAKPSRCPPVPRPTST